MTNNSQIDLASTDWGDAKVVFRVGDDKTSSKPNKPWKVLISDDDEEVHVITQMVLRDLHFDGRAVELLSAHSGEQTLTLLAEHPDTAVLLLDVVMESEQAGLNVVRRIRESLGNRLVRIILRTGQPGQAPEKRVIIDYDINDYKEKTELTAQKLTTIVIAALRSFRDINTIERSRQGLMRVINASRDLFESQSLSSLSSGVLQQISALLHLGDDCVLAHSSGLAVKLDTADRSGSYVVLAGTGRYTSNIGQPLEEVMSAADIEKLLQMRCEQIIVGNGEFKARFCSTNGTESFIVVQTPESGEPLDVDLLRLFSTNLGVAFENAHLRDELVHQKDVLEQQVTLRTAEVVQQKSLVDQKNKELEKVILELESSNHELGTANAALAIANLTQEEHQSELTRFLAVASHDLRQPMHALNLYLGALLNVDLPETARPLLVNVRQCANIMDDMFMALLDLSRLDAHVVQPQVECFSIASILARLEVEFAPQANAKGLALMIGPHAAWVESDSSLVQQILANLTANAVRYTDAGTITIHCSHHGDRLRVAVTDTGIGISPHQQKTVFEEFCQLGNANHDHAKGLGLGLAIVKRLCKLLDAPVTLVSALGEGSTFAIDLPLAMRTIGEAPLLSGNGQMIENESLRNKLIVVVDDEESILVAMRVLLEQWGCTVVVAASESEAIAKLSRVGRLPNVLICDYSLRSKENGIDVIESLRNEFNQDIPALLVTGDTAPGLIQRTLASGLTILYKPVQAAALREKLVHLISEPIQQVS